MPWFRVDDTLHSHPKVREAGLPAVGLWSVAGAYAMNYKTDGVVPRWFVTGWPAGVKLAQRLVAAGLWDKVPEGFKFHDWDDYQPTAEDIEADRANARNRQRARRERLRKHPSGDHTTTEVTANVTRDVGGDVHRESRDPVPTRPMTVVKTPGQSSPQRATGLTDDQIEAIHRTTGGTRAHAVQAADAILAKATDTVFDPVAYIRRAVADDPGAYRHRRGNPTKATACPEHPGEWADACRIHALEAKHA